MIRDTASPCLPCGKGRNGNLNRPSLAVKNKCGETLEFFLSRNELLNKEYLLSAQIHNARQGGEAEGEGSVHLYMTKPEAKPTTYIEVNRSRKTG
jgi:hypothetical protein